MGKCPSRSGLADCCVGAGIVLENGFREDVRTEEENGGKMMVNIEKVIIPEEGFIRLPTVLKVLGISRTALYNGIARGDFPKPVRLGPRMSAWKVEEIRKFIADCGEQK